ncbi:hypothetical protein DAI22_09g135900 [Oryza sativa Japonica Group]|nr:hypothetical protein DAI22_09g135900 [Oryza sativa Japonica Group]
MSSSPWPPTTGAASAAAAAASPAPPEGAAGGAATPAAAPATTSEQRPVKEGGDAAAAGAAAAVQQQEEEEVEAKPQLLREDDSETEIQVHEQKINKYQAILAARLKAKYFSNKDFDGGNVFEEITVEGETIQSSRWPCTRSFADPVNFFRDKNSHERSDSPSLTADSAAKNNSPRTDSSPKNSASALATENNLTPGKRQPSKKI